MNISCRPYARVADPNFSHGSIIRETRTERLVDSPFAGRTPTLVLDPWIETG